MHKCQLFKNEVDYLGFKISAARIHASPEKVRALSDWRLPQPAVDVWSFWGLFSYRKKFIGGFFQIFKLLTDLSRDKVVWRWRDVEAKCFT